MTTPSRLTTLCFHGIGEPGRALEPGEERFWITEDQFTTFLDVVMEHPEPVELTFDDANESDHRLALPVLTSRHLTASFFVIAGRLSTPGSLSVTQMREIGEAGMIVGNHGYHHRPWHDVSPDELTSEVIDAGRVIGDHLEAPVTRAACPRGSYDRRVLHLLRHNGYDRVYTVDEGSSRPGAWLRNRYTVITSDSAATVRERLEHPDGSVGSRLDRTIRQLAKRWR